MSSQKFSINQLRQAMIVEWVQTLAIMFFTIFLMVFLPQLLIRYVYANQALLTEPALLTYMPVVLFTIGTAAFLYALVKNVLRARQIMKLEQDMKTMPQNCHCEGGVCVCSSSDMGELEAMASKLVETANKKTSASKTKKRTTRKTSK